MSAFGLLLMMVGSFYALLIILSAGSSFQLNPNLAIGALCMAAAVFGFAIIVEHRLTRRSAKQAVASALLDTWAEDETNDLASLTELDELIDEQDRYFGLQLAIALRDKARHFPIRVTDLQEIRLVLQNDIEIRQEAPTQVTHLTRIINRLSKGYVD